MLSKESKEKLRVLYIVLMLSAITIVCAIETNLTLAFLSMGVWIIALEISEGIKARK